MPLATAGKLFFPLRAGRRHGGVSTVSDLLYLE
jgi:hypothetical protein